MGYVAPEIVEEVFYAVNSLSSMKFAEDFPTA